MNSKEEIVLSDSTNNISTRSTVSHNVTRPTQDNERQDNGGNTLYIEKSSSSKKSSDYFRKIWSPDNSFSHDDDDIIIHNDFVGDENSEIETTSFITPEMSDGSLLEIGMNVSSDSDGELKTSWESSVEGNFSPPSSILGLSDTNTDNSCESAESLGNMFMNWTDAEDCFSPKLQNLYASGMDDETSHKSGCPQPSADYFEREDKDYVDGSSNQNLEAEDLFTDGGDGTVLGHEDSEKNMVPFKSTSSEQSSRPSADRYAQGMKQHINMPIFMKSIRKFAADNNFEIEDSNPRGDCMFQAVADQLTTNGIVRHTAESLREDAVRYLRENPRNSEGSHLASFVSSETWEHYLRRMENISEWGDHIMLKAMSDFLKMEIAVFNVYEDDILHTIIEPVKKDNSPINKFTIYLGHVGEFHYLSLRQANWETSWPYKAIISATCSLQRPGRERSVKSSVQTKLRDMGRSRTVEEAGIGEFLSCVQKWLENESGTPSTTDTCPGVEIYEKNSHEGSSNETFLDEKSEENASKKESDNKMKYDAGCDRTFVEDPLHTDLLSNVPLPHLTFLIQVLLPVDMFVISHQSKPYIYEGFLMEITGSIGRGTRVYLEDSSTTKEMSCYHRNTIKNRAKLNITDLNHKVCFKNIPTAKHLSFPLIADTSSTHPGYCFLRPSNKRLFQASQLHSEGGEIFVKGFQPSHKIVRNHTGDKIYSCYHSPFLPLDMNEWIKRLKPFNWPSPAIVQEIIRSGCAIVYSAHPASNLPHIEWKMCFLNAEKLLFSKGLTCAQKHAFFVLKIVVDYMTKNLKTRLKTKHMRAVFFYACERIPKISFETCLSGSVLYILSYLLESLRKKCISHYFISSNNMIDYYCDGDVTAIAVCIEALRLFPVQSFQFLANRHGYSYACRVQTSVLRNCASFNESRNLNSVYETHFIPNTILVVEELAKLGHCIPAQKLAMRVLTDMSKIPSATLKKPGAFERLINLYYRSLQQIRDRGVRQNLQRIFPGGLNYRVAPHSKTACKKTLDQVIPFHVDPRIGNVGFPDHLSNDLASVANYVDSVGRVSFVKGNFEIALLAVETAIKIIKHTLKDYTLDEQEISDENLRNEISTQKTSIENNLNVSLMNYYTHLCAICQQQYSQRPLLDYMQEIESLCEKIPFKSQDVANMWLYLGRPDKASLYIAKMRMFAKTK